MARTFLIMDFEFTGLDNNFIDDNEIIQTKLLVCDYKYNILDSFIWTHITDKDNLAGSFLCNGITKDEQIDPMFSLDWWKKEVFPIIKKYNIKSDEIFGFAPKMDNLMLSKYHIPYEFHIQKDIQEMAQLTDEYEFRLATEGRSLETVYYIVCEKLPNLANHGDLQELELIRQLVKKLENIKRNTFLNYVPWGFCAGMPIDDYVVNYRRNADGYRFNNSDTFASSIDFHIEKYENQYNYY